MKRFFVALLLLASTVFNAAASAEEAKPAETKGERHYFSVQLLYPLSTNKSKDDFSYANFSLIYGHIGEVRGADLGYVGSFVRRDMTGVQGSYVFAYTGGSLYGVGLSGIGHYADNDLSGLQAAGIFTYTGKALKGFQGAGIANIAAGGMKGVQASGAVNIASGAMRGLQISTVNIAGETKGMQIGLVNIAGDISGMQLGLVNISKTMNGVPLGLVNISENGGIELVAWGSSLMAANAGVRFRANYVYTLIAAGGYNFERDKDKDKSAAASMYFGIRVPVSRLYVDVDAGGVAIDNGKLFDAGERNEQLALQGRGIAGFRVTDSFSVFAGGGVSYLLDRGEGFSDGSYKPLYLGGVAYEF